jgi:hypothetical protein
VARKRIFATLFFDLDVPLCLMAPLAGVVAKVERPPRVPGQRRPPLLSKQVHETVANSRCCFVVLHRGD